MAELIEVEVACARPELQVVRVLSVPLEVYRPLHKDPREARREAVAQGTVLGRPGR